MKSLTLPFTLILSAGLSIGAAHGTTYVWTGAAGNGDWDSTGNWDSAGVPVDDVGGTGIDINGFNLNPENEVRFSGTSMPTTNIPSFGGGNSFNNRATPTILLDSGGVLSINLDAAREGGVWTQSGSRTVFTIGDGIGGAGDTTLDLTISGTLNRHNEGVTHSYLVNSDGVFNIAGTGALTYSFSDNRFTQILLNGGTFDTERSINRQNTTSNFVDFQSTGASFTAGFGNSFGNIGLVESQIGTDTFFRSSNALDLAAVDNGNGTFTVSVIPEPSTLSLAGLAALCFLRRRR